MCWAIGSKRLLQAAGFDRIASPVASRVGWDHPQKGRLLCSEKAVQKTISITSDSKVNQLSYAGDARVSTVQHSRSSARCRIGRSQSPIRGALCRLPMIEGACVGLDFSRTPSGRGYRPHYAAKKIALTRMGVCGHFYAPP
jgi:hypothetical protein